MTNCKDCEQLAEALNATVQLAYYLVNDLSQEERASIKQQLDVMFQEMDQNPPPSSDDNNHTHRTQS